MRSIATTTLEIGAGIAGVAGVYILFGLGWALIGFAVVAVAFSWLVSR